MTNVKITDLTSYSNPDPAVDVFPIVDVANNVTKKITRNNYLGINGVPVGTTDSQSLSNKTIGNSNTVSLKDALFTLQDDADTTKQAQFQLSGITTGTTRTYTLPNASSTLADISTSQTLTNKTLSAPTITNGSITGTTITTDAIVGQSVSTNGTVYGLSITGGKISGASLTAGTVGSTALATNAVQANQLATNAITLGYTQITTNYVPASGSLAAVTGLTASVTIPSGGRRVRVTVYVSGISFANAQVVMTLWDGTVGSGTQLQEADTGGSQSIANQFINMQFIHTPAAGAKTYNVGYVGPTSTTLNASSIKPAFILVEAI